MRGMMDWSYRGLTAIAACVLLCATMAWAHDDAMHASPPPVPTTDPAVYTAGRSVPITFETRDGRRLTGTIIEYDLDTFLLDRGNDDQQTIAWRELTAIDTAKVFGRCMTPNSAEENFRLGQILARLDDGEALAARIFQNAVKLDPRYKEHVQAFRASGEVLPSPPPAHVEPLPGPITAETPVPIRPSDYTWQSLSEKELATFIEKEKEFVAAVLEYLDVEMRLIETEHYLFYTNADPREVTKMSVLLENMYRRLSQMLDVPPEVNIWKGKALVFLCADAELYHRIEREIFKNPRTEGTAGICHAYRTGEVRICFMMTQDPWDLRHLLVHETTHGFLHRYRSPRVVPNWLNEGLAEYMGTRLVVQSNFNRYRRNEGRRELARRNSFEGALDRPNIPFWFYGVSLQLVEMLMQKDREGVFHMLRDIKDGMPWEESLMKRYELTPEQMAEELRKYLRLTDEITLE